MRVQSGVCSKNDVLPLGMSEEVAEAVPVTDVALDEYPGVFRTGAGPTRSGIQDGDLGEIDHLQTGPTDARAPVEILGIHEVALVQPAGLLVSLARDHDEGADQPVDGLHRSVVHRVGEDAHLVIHDALDLSDDIPGECDIRAGGVLDVAPAVFHLRRYGADFRVHVHETDHRADVRAQRAGDSVNMMREEAFRSFEEKYEGKEKMTDDLREYAPFRNLDRSTLYRLVKSRGYAYVTNRTFLVKHHEAA